MHVVNDNGTDKCTAEFRFPPQEKPPPSFWSPKNFLPKSFLPTKRLAPWVGNGNPESMDPKDHRGLTMNNPASYDQVAIAWRKC